MIQMSPPISPIYLDYMATTPVDPVVMQAMCDCLTSTGIFGNAASMHRFGLAAKEAIEAARQQVACAICADPKDIVFTSGATEADNLAISGAMAFYQRKGRHMITAQTEHKAVLETCRYLETQGVRVTYLPVLSSGLVDLDQLENAICPDTVLVSLMLANNEIGVIQDISAVSQLLKNRGILLHVDAAQALGKITIDVQQLGVDLLSLSAHKCYGPKGIGALYVRHSRPRIRLQPQLFGGSHERGLRPGTSPTHQIVGFGAACELLKKQLEQEYHRISFLQQRLWTGFQSGLNEAVSINGDLSQSLPHCLNVRFDDIAEEQWLSQLPHLAVSSGSACTSADPRPSHVLLSLGLSPVQANNSIRISLGRYTTVEEIDNALDYCIEIIKRLRCTPQIWQRVKKNVINKAN